MVTVYTQEGCQPCRMTKRKLDTLHVAYTEVDIDSNPQIREDLKAQGYMGAPVVIPANGQGWAGFSLEKIKTLATA